MSSPSLKKMSYLDKILHVGGIKGLHNFFNTLSQYNRDQARNLINDERLQFSTLFILQSEFREFNFDKILNRRNKRALELTKSILLRQHDNIDDLTSSNRRGSNYTILKWMFESGCNDDGLSNQFDEVLETAAVLLVKTYKDISILPIIAEMIFRRNRKGHLIYDLVWAFMEAKKPQSLILIANGLRSENQKDVELSRKLLSFIPCISMNTGTDKVNLYSCCLNWINENHLFLYYTGEGFQQTCNPIPYYVCLEAKYMCKGISPDSMRFLIPLTMSEQKLIDQFRTQDYNAKKVLSDYSYWLYHQDLNSWNIWHSYPVSVQLHMALNKIGGLL